MKNITLLVALFAVITATAQDFTGKRPELLKGKEVKILPLQEKDLKRGYKGFYTDAKLLTSYAQNSNYNSKPDSLIGRTFRVENVETQEKPDHIDARVTLKDAKGRVIYYDYDSRFGRLPEYAFEVVGGLTLPADFYCDDITFTQKEGAGEEYKTKTADGITFRKFKVNGETSYMMETKQISNIRVDNPKNAAIMLENNKTISKPDAAVGFVSNPGGTYTYIATFYLTPAEVELLTNNKMVSGKIHTIESNVVDSGKLKGMLGCLVTK